MKYHAALVIGRFQPFHPGHMYLIEKALSMADEVVIGIGSTNIQDIDNPFSFDERKTMLETWIAKEEIGKRIVKIVPIPDVPDDKEWLKIAVQATGPVDVVLGNNDWVNDLYREMGVPVIAVDLYKRHIYEGKKIRAKMRKNGQLE